MTWQQLAQKHANENTRIATAELRDGIGKDIKSPEFTMKWADRKKQLLDRQFHETSKFIEEEIKTKKHIKSVHDSIAMSQRNAAWLDNGMQDEPEKSYEQKVMDKYNSTVDEKAGKRAEVNKDLDEQNKVAEKVRKQMEQIFNSRNRPKL